MTNNYKDLEKSIFYSFKDKDLLENALTHRGFYYSNEDSLNHNEKLEFLGDRVLGLTISSYLYKNYTDINVGQMAKYFSYIVGSDNLLKIATKLNLASYVKINKNQLNTGVVDKILIDAVEALIGAIYLESSFQEVEKIIFKLFKSSFESLSTKILNPKGLLQEFTQKNNLPLPDYKVISQEGPDHKPSFTVRLLVKGFNPIETQSLNIKNAQKDLAEEFIKKHMKKSK